MTSLNEKLVAARGTLRDCGSVIIAYSGGIDSALVMKLAADELGDRALAVTSDSPSVPRSELADAAALAKATGVRHRVVQTHEMDNADYAANPANRCYFCKQELYTQLVAVAREEGLAYIANGTNVDDLGDHRPGLEAAEEFQIVSPLRDAGFTKADIRAAAKQLGLPVWDKPASPCLSSRIPYGSSVTPQKLKMVESAEAYLHESGYRECRVRHFGTRARVEVPAAELARAEADRAAIALALQRIGFLELELTPFRSGALNDELEVGATPAA